MSPNSVRAVCNEALLLNAGLRVLAIARSINVVEVLLQFEGARQGSRLRYLVETFGLAAARTGP